MMKSNAAQLPATLRSSWWTAIEVVQGARPGGRIAPMKLTSTQCLPRILEAW